VTLPALNGLDPARFDAPSILKRVAAAGRALGELKGVAASIPNQAILVNTLALQEAKDSSAIENIATTHDELFRDSLFPDEPGNAAAKEVARYAQALRLGYEKLLTSGLLTNNQILEIQRELERNRAGFRRVPGTTVSDGEGNVIYTPPSPDLIAPLMSDLERFINDDGLLAVDPLIKMALIHHQFESIHPFYDGNGRTGRIINVLYLVRQGLLDSPVLYMSRYIVRTKADYYRLLQSVRNGDAWEEWVEYMLTAVEETARDGIRTIVAIREALLDYKHRIRGVYKFYSQDLINMLFSHPYTKIQFAERELGVSRLTATRYLEALSEGGLLAKQRVGRSNYYINPALYSILTGDEVVAPANPTL
jgi:Fic family protein